MLLYHINLEINAKTKPSVQYRIRKKKFPQNRYLSKPPLTAARHNKSFGEPDLLWIQQVQSSNEAVL